MSRIGCLALLACFLGGAAPAAAQELKTLEGQAGDVKATLTFAEVQIGENPRMSLRIERAGQVVHDGPVRHPRFKRPGDFVAADPDRSLTVRDLDGRGAAEVIVDVYTGGAHCCWVSLVYRASGSTFRPTLHDWGNQGYRLRDLDRDGRPEFRTADDSFAFAFCSFADSSFPVQIWRYRRGRLRDATRSRLFRTLVRKDASTLLRRYTRGRREGGCGARAALAAWTADMLNLRRGREALRRVERERKAGHLRRRGAGDTWPAGRKYVRELRRHLKDFGYIR